MRVEHNTEAKKEYFFENRIAKNVTTHAIKTYDPSNSSKKNSSIKPTISENNWRINGLLMTINRLPKNEQEFYLMACWVSWWALSSQYRLVTRSLLIILPEQYLHFNTSSIYIYQISKTIYIFNSLNINPLNQNQQKIFIFIKLLNWFKLIKKISIYQRKRSVDSDLDSFRYIAIGKI